MAKIRDIRSAVRALTNQTKDELTEAEIYTSRQMLTYLKDMSESICGDSCKAPNIHIIADGENGLTACTNEFEVIINYETSLCRFFSTPESRFMAFMGLFYHEHSHVLYNDFDADKRAKEALQRGELFGNEPKVRTPEEADALSELMTAIRNPVYTPIFSRVYAELSNTVADPHDEGKIMDEFGGMAVESIMKMNEALWASTLSLENAEKLVQSGQQTKLSVMYSLILDYIYFSNVLCFDEELEKKSELVGVLYSVSAHIETARWTDDPKERYSELNYVVLALWPYIRDELQKTAQNQSGGSGKNRNPTKEQIRQILDQLQQGAQNAPQTMSPRGRTSVKALNNVRAAQQGKQPPKTQQSGGSQQSQDALSEAFNQVATDLAQQYAETKLEESESTEIRRNAENRLSQTSSHKDIPVDITRVYDVSDKDISDYEEVMKEIGPYSKRLQKQVLDIMKDLRMGSLNRHKPFGRIICARDAYRPDELMFANKKNPIDLPDMAVSVLVDHSGSMTGVRIDASCKAAILLHDFARGIGIPVAVSGHRTQGKGIEYIVYTDFNQYSDRDRYRLTRMKAEACNRDGAAIEIAADRLVNRPEKMKLLIVISDGQPNHLDYGGEEAEADIRNIIGRYKRKGVEIIGAAIGEDRDTISRIYGDGFLDISDLSTLPKTLTRLVQKRLLSQIV